MNINDEGKFYASMVRKYKSEGGQRSLQQFCAAEKISYLKMLHCTVRENYRFSQKAPKKQSAVVSKQTSGIKPLIVDAPQAAPEAPVSPVACRPTDPCIGFDDVKIQVSGKANLLIGHCDVTSLVRLIKEMEGSSC